MDGASCGGFGEKRAKERCLTTLRNYSTGVGLKQPLAGVRYTSPLRRYAWPSHQHARVNTAMHKSMITADGHDLLFPGNHHCVWRYAPALHYQPQRKTAPARAWIFCVVQRALASGITPFPSVAIF